MSTAPSADPYSDLSNSPPREPASPFSSPQEEALIHLMRSADCLHHAMQRRLKPFGITITQYNVLRILRRSQGTGLTCSAIGKRMIAPEPDITRLLARLKTQKLVCQRRDGQDKRAVWTHITPEGMEILTKLDGIVGEAPKELLQELTGEELRQLTRLLQKTHSCAEPEPRGNAGPFSSEPAFTAKLPSPRSARSSLPRHHPE